MDTRAILIRQIRELPEQRRLRMLWDLTAENVPEQEAWDIEHPIIVTPTVKPTPPGRMTPDELWTFIEAMERDVRRATSPGSTARERDERTLAEIFLKELAKRGRL